METVRSGVIGLGCRGTSALKDILLGNQATPRRVWAAWGRFVCRVPVTAAFSAGCPAGAGRGQRAGRQAA